ncbi:uncharacterized protein LOC128961720 [Oppia nitens]|uniref:uncharacterized protein LOC128961720 n=1 Tax=Oppia nitens TaxID=1686743 RepID=UPI0023DC5D73|nr:uncharacterized protein LOC128961720 [Oppia nitens]
MYISSAISFLLLLLYVSVVAVDPDTVSVYTPNGQLIGRKEQSADGTEVHVFRGIPYGEPPVGELRFRRPVPTKKWTNKRNALTFGKTCYQMTGFLEAHAGLSRNDFSEDCLYLNVWSKDSMVSEDNLKAVVFWIHGGALLTGSTSEGAYDAKELVALGDVVFVSANYRLSTFGFLFAATDDAPGNVGLWDQTLALEWVRDNIRYFGGDPNRITIFGENAGAWSASLHVLSPQSHHLFKRAILASGAYFDHFIDGSPEEFRDLWLYGAELIGCGQNATEFTPEIMSCLRDTDAETLASIPSIDGINVRNIKLFYLVVVDGHFLPQIPSKLLADVPADLDLLVSTAEDEGSFILQLLYSFRYFHAKQPYNYTHKEAVNELTNIASLVSIDGWVDGQQVAKHYFALLSDQNGFDTLRRTIGIAIGDYYFTCPTLEFAREVYAHSDGRINVYEFAYWAKTRDNFLCSSWMGSCQANDLIPMFGIPLVQESTDREKEISRQMMSFITDFAKHGEPTVQMGVRWPAYWTIAGQVVRPYVKVTVDGTHFGLDHKRTECQLLWRQYLENSDYLVKRHLLYNCMSFSADQFRRGTSQQSRLSSNTGTIDMSRQLLVLWLLSGLCAAEEVSVRLKDGFITGKRETVLGKELNVFRGIPYAQPPVGPLRFRRPLPPKPRTDPIEAFDFSPACRQNGQMFEIDHYLANRNYSEDCLYLNIWAPPTNDDLLPVMVWIHGGGLLVGSASEVYYHGDALAAKGEVILVSLNYRVNTLGFLYAGTDEAPGNVGLWDQSLALEWVRDNIRYFGGDPDRITIFGESAGGWSTSLHIISPQSRNLFRRAIVASGAHIYNYSSDKPEDHIKRWLRGAKLVGCEAKDNRFSPEVMDCLRSVDADKLVAITDNVDLMDGVVKVFNLVVVDGHFLPTRPIEMLLSGDYKRDVDLIVSTVQDEGSFLLTWLTDPIKFHPQNPYNFTYDEAVDELTAITSDLCSERRIDGKDVSRLYYGSLSDNHSSDDILRVMGVAVGDYYLTCPTIEFAKQVYANSNGRAKVYQYYFNAKQQTNFFCSKWMGVCHTNDIFPMFGQPFTQPDEYVDREREISDQMIRFITDFAKHGEPTAQRGVKWPSYWSIGDNIVMPYLEIGNEEKPEISPFGMAFKHTECDLLWDKYLLGLD